MSQSGNEWPGQEGDCVEHVRVHRNSFSTQSRLEPLLDLHLLRVLFAPRVHVKLQRLVREWTVVKIQNAGSHIRLQLT